MGKLEEAIYKEQERLCRQLGNDNGLCVTLVNQGLNLARRGEKTTAIRLIKEGLSMAKAYQYGALVERFEKILKSIK